MPVVQYGSVATTAPVVPGLTVVNVPPQVAVINGTPIGRVGVVGVASWGPVNTATIASAYSDGSVAFGPMGTRKHDLMTQVYVAALQGASDFRLVRVTDGTDAAATATIAEAELAKAPAFYAALAAAINAGTGVLRGASAVATFSASTGLLSGLYTGSLGNGIVVSVTNGSRMGTFRAVVGISGQSPEVYDNLPAVAGATPTLAAYLLTGGADGAANVTSAQLVGLDAQPRSGIYALRGTGIRHLVVADLDDSTQWTVVDAMAVSESAYAHQVAPAGSSIASVVAAKAAAGLDSPWTSLMHGDWLVINDPVNSVQRLVSPAAFKAGLLASLSPQNSSLNKRLAGIVASQTSADAAGAYSSAELSELLGAGIDVVCNPALGGAYWAVRGGINSSSNGAEDGDNYTTMANFLDTSIDATMGEYVGQTINPTMLQNASASLNNFLSGLVDTGVLASQDGVTKPYSVTCDASNNPGVRTSQGYVRADVQVQTQAINRFFSVYCESGPTVIVGSAPVA